MSLSKIIETKNVIALKMNLVSQALSVSASEWYP